MADHAVSIVVVTHDAPRWIARMLRTLSRTRGIDYELVVVDNRSRAPTRLLLAAAAFGGRIDRLCLLDRNTLFAEGNNIGVAAASRDAPLVLLLNSDVEVRDPYWLRRLVDAHERGATSLGYVDAEPWRRADGYCLLVDRDLYVAHGLDEGFAWWWSVTRLQARLLAAGRRVLAIREHDELLIHFGGRSGEPPQTAAGMAVSGDEVRSWFDGREVEVRDRL